jgi:hypothetical protein
VTSGPLFVAYVYGGWHRSPWRDDILEWDLFDNFKQYFPGHPKPFRPLHGPYDDLQPSVARWQIDLAISHGISAFSYFLYADRSGFIMDGPIRNAFEVAPTVHVGFGIGLTWCLRLPHHELPIPATFQSYRKTGTLTTDRSSGRVRTFTVGEVLNMIGARNPDSLDPSVVTRTSSRPEML